MSSIGPFFASMQSLSNIVRRTRSNEAISLACQENMRIYLHIVDCRYIYSALHNLYILYITWWRFWYYEGKPEPHQCLVELPLWAGERKSRRGKGEKTQTKQKSAAAHFSHLIFLCSSKIAFSALLLSIWVITENSRVDSSVSRDSLLREKSDAVVSLDSFAWQGFKLSRLRCDSQVGNCYKSRVTDDNSHLTLYLEGENMSHFVHKVHA